MSTLKKPAGVIILYLCFNIAFGQQKNLSLSFKPVFANKEFVLNDSTYLIYKGNLIKFKTLRFYISGIRLFKDNALVWDEQNSFHLYDAFEDPDKLIELKVPAAIKFNRIKFNFGIDSITNVSGAMGGDLDPTKGMYWAWQSGYINFKLEGESDLSPDPKKEFQFHLGGYQNPYNTLQKVSLQLIQKEKIIILFDLYKFIEACNLEKQHHIMSPNNDALKLLKHAAQCFSIKNQ